MKIGITGHQRLPQAEDWIWVRDQMDHILSTQNQPFEGITCLAAGTDQLFAELILKRGGLLYSIVPFEGYERTFSDIHDQNRYHDFRKVSNEMEVLEWKESDEESFLIAGKRVVDLSNLLITVWNGRPAAGLGGTADVVNYAQIKHVNISPLTFEVHHLR